jgi:hypothetical protein
VAERFAAEGAENAEREKEKRGFTTENTEKDKTRVRGKEEGWK